MDNGIHIDIITTDDMSNQINSIQPESRAVEDHVFRRLLRITALGTDG